MDRFPERPASAEEDGQRVASAGPPKKRAALTSLELEWENTHETMDEDDELQRYISAVNTMDSDRDVLGWWRAHKEVYPKLSMLVRAVYCTPASSSSSERNFSVAGRAVTKRRNALKGSTVDGILFLRDAYKNKV